MRALIIAPVPGYGVVWSAVSACSSSAEQMMHVCECVCVHVCVCVCDRVGFILFIVERVPEGAKPVVEREGTGTVVALEESAVMRSTATSRPRSLSL